MSDKGRKALRRMKVRPVPELNRSEMDKNIFDVVMQYLYVNADKNSLDLDKEVLSHMSITLPESEKQRVWEVLTSSIWINSIVGFGNAGKIELSKAGFQLMSQFGSYSNYLAAVQTNPETAKIINPEGSVSGTEKTPGEEHGVPGGHTKKK